MLDERSIRDDLRASRVIPLTISSPHGPLGLEQLAEEVRRLVTAGSRLETVARPIPLNTESWQKLDQKAHKSSVSPPALATASDVADAIIKHYVANLPR